MKNIEIQHESKQNNKMRIRKAGHKGTSGEMEEKARAKARKWPAEKELLDKCDGLATAAGSETRPRYYIQYRHATMNETRGISSAENCPLRTAEVGLGVVA